MNNKLIRVQAECTSEECIGDYEVQLKLHMKLFNQPPHRSKEVSNSTQMELLCGSKITGDSQLMTVTVVEFICKELNINPIDMVKQMINNLVYDNELYDIQNHILKKIAISEKQKLKETL